MGENIFNIYYARIIKIIAIIEKLNNTLIIHKYIWTYIYNYIYVKSYYTKKLIVAAVVIMNN